MGDVLEAEEQKAALVVVELEDDDENMVAKGALGTYKPTKPSPARYRTLVLILVAYSLGGG